MTTALSPQLMGDDENNNQQRQQQRSSDIPTNFIFERPISGPARLNNKQRSANGTTVPYIQTSDLEHNSGLLEHLATDLANLLNRTDISDCFLNVQGTFMAVHKCILAARSNAFAGNEEKDFSEIKISFCFFPSCCFQWF
jgi:hypothetical protein